MGEASIGERRGHPRGGLADATERPCRAGKDYVLPAMTAAIRVLPAAIRGSHRGLLWHIPPQVFQRMGRIRTRVLLAQLYEYPADALGYAS